MLYDAMLPAELFWLSYPHCTLQWGLQTGLAPTSYITWPIAMSSIYAVMGCDYDTTGNPLALSFYNISSTGCDCRGVRVVDGTQDSNCRWIAIGR